MYDAALGIENVVGSHHGDGGALGRGQNFRFAVLDVIKGVLSVQIHTEPAGRIHIANLLVEVQVYLLVDDFQGTTHRHGRTVCLKHLLEPGEDSHAGTDGRLRQVHRGNVAVLEFFQRRTQLPAKNIDEVTPGGLGCIFRAFAADQHD